MSFQTLLSGDLCDALGIDRNNFNNSRTAEPNPKPALKLTNYWLFVTQWLGQALAWWAV